MATAKKKSTKGKKRKKKKSVAGRVLLFVIEILVILLLVVVFVKYKKTSDNIVRTELKEEELEINTELDAETIEAMEDYTTVALFGTEYTGHSDTIIIVAINNESKEMKLCSVYRDTYLNMTNGDYNKANAAYASGGPQQAVAMLNSNLDLSIRDFIAIDFKAMVEMVDTIGGIDLDLSAEEAAIMNGQSAESKEDYIATLLMYTKYGTVNADELASKMDEEDRKELVNAIAEEHVSSGHILADGIQTAAYCRIRYTTGWDFKRAERQREVINKIVEKTKAQGVGKAVEVVNAVTAEKGVNTSFSDAALLDLAKKMIDYSIVDDVGFPFFKNTSDLNGSIVVPCDLQTNVDYLHDLLYDNEAYIPTNQVRKISADIIAKTGMNRKDAVEMYDSVENAKMPEETYGD
ncbi:MAG: LCP family protein [Lachnospiraceae bacterium]|nr:LCP family protein [Lachnospiraceae bacterium]